jgi:hypothetical protein
MGSQDRGSSICVAVTSSGIEFLEAVSECPAETPFDDVRGVTLGQLFQGVADGDQYGAAIFEYPTPSVLYRVSNGESERPVLRQATSKIAVEPTTIEVDDGVEVLLWVIGADGSDEFDLTGSAIPDRTVSYTESNGAAIASFDADDQRLEIG